MAEALPDIEELKFKAHRYSTTPEVVEAIRISKDNIQFVEDWCGGTVNESYIGDWVVKFKDNRFMVMRDEDFSKKYRRTGLRLD